MGDLIALHAKAVALRQNILEELGIQHEIEEGNRLLERTTAAKKRIREQTKEKNKTTTTATTPSSEARRSLRVQGKTPTGDLAELKPGEGFFSPGPGAPLVKPPTEPEVDIFSYVDPRPGMSVENTRIFIGYLNEAEEQRASGSSGSTSKSPSRSKSSPAKKSQTPMTSLSSSSSSTLFLPSRRDPSILTKLSVPSDDYVVKAFYGQSNRIYSVGFHPMSNRGIAIMGSRFGELAFWYPDFSTKEIETSTKRTKTTNSKHNSSSSRTDNTEESRSSTSNANEDTTSSTNISSSSADPNEDEGNDNEEEGNVAVFKLHDSVINSYFVPPTAHHHVITSSYGTDIRLLDANKGMSYEIYNDGTTPSQLAYDPSETGIEHCFYVGNREGQLFYLDLRTKEKKISYIDAHEKKITSISLRNGGLHLLSGAGDGTVKIWDARKIAERGSSARSTVTPLSTLQHQLLVTGAAFSPSGRFVASVCNDNKIRLWDTANVTSKASNTTVHDSTEYGIPEDPSCSNVSHNNHTGRWLTPFKLCWDQGAEHTLLIGNMIRGIDFFTVKPGLGSRGHPGLELVSTLMDPALTAVPTQTAVHSSLNMVVGGTASGKAYIFI